MKSKAIQIAIFIFLFHSLINAQNAGKHLFILSGQSNMARMNPENSFIPALEMEFGKENIITVKSALGGQPIRRWYKKWEAPNKDSKFEATADLYDSLMLKVFPAIKNQNIETVTFIWMQGERDAREALGSVYKKSLVGVYEQLGKDLNRKDINFIIGRLSDYKNPEYVDWDMIREIQMEVGESNAHYAWINTDDLNSGINTSGKQVEDDLHLSEAGYEILGKRYAENAIRIINLEKPK